MLAELPKMLTEVTKKISEAKIISTVTKTNSSQKKMSESWIPILYFVKMYDIHNSSLCFDEFNQVNMKVIDLLIKDSSYKLYFSI